MENIEKYQDLANAIVEMTARDYMKAKKRLKKYPENKEALGQVEECTRFFHSNWYKILTNVDGDKLLAKLDKVVTA